MNLRYITHPVTPQNKDRTYILLYCMSNIKRRNSMCQIMPHKKYINFRRFRKIAKSYY